MTHYGQLLQSLVSNLCELCEAISGHINLYRTMLFLHNNFTYSNVSTLSHIRHGCALLLGSFRGSKLYECFHALTLEWEASTNIRAEFLCLDYWMQINYSRQTKFCADEIFVWYILRVAKLFRAPFMPLDPHLFISLPPRHTTFRTKPWPNHGLVVATQHLIQPRVDPFWERSRNYQEWLVLRPSDGRPAGKGQ